MPRQSRQSSGTGIYHVMMRGINHQKIFEDQEDYYQFLSTLDMMARSYEPDGTPYGRNYILYAYCLMSNHIHLLIREREDKIGMSIKRIASSYVYYYNHKYLRDGHLFRERFKSELVNEPLSDDVACLDIEEALNRRPSDDQVMLLIKKKTGATNSSAFQQLPDEVKKSVLIELKARKASLRQLERLTGIGKSMIYRI